MSQITLSPGAMAVGLGVIVGGFLLWRGARVAGQVAGAVGDAAQAVNPLNPENIFAAGANAVGDAVVSEDGAGRNADGSWTLGGWWFDTWNPETAQAVKDVTKPVFTGGASGEW
jgi:hypothetical protein